MPKHKKHRSPQDKRTNFFLLLLLIIVITALSVILFRQKRKHVAVMAADSTSSQFEVLEPALSSKAKAEAIATPTPTPTLPDFNPAAFAQGQARNISKGDYILVEKSKHLLSHYRDGSLLRSYSVAVGMNPKDKERVGDNATPEGHFEINFIKDSSSWSHDFKDGKGEIPKAYGPYFMALYTGKQRTFAGIGTWTGIGIHGTHDPDSVGKDATEGCVRLRNEELLELHKEVKDKGHVQVDIIK